jgi:hypothetical protein
MSEAVRTMASPAATWAIVVTASCLTLFMAMAALAANHFQIREHRRMRMFGMWPSLDEAPPDQWPRLSETLFAAAGAVRPAAAGVTAAPGDTATRHDIPAQRPAMAEGPEAAQLAAAYAEQPEAESPTEPIPAAETTRPDLPAQEAPGRHAGPLPAQRSGESDRAERSLAGPAPRDEDEDEQ